MIYSKLVGLTACFCFGSVSCAQVPPDRPLPRPVLKPLTLLGSWESAPAVVTGEVRNMHLLAEEQVHNLPGPASPSLSRIYWCVADLEVALLLKGEKPAPGKKYLWASATRGCTLTTLEQLPKPAVKIWLIREEENWIRPVVDAFGVFWLWLAVDQNALAGPNPLQRFGQLLLEPGTTAPAIHAFVNSLESFSSLACYLLGDRYCLEGLTKLASSKNEKVRAAACRVLEIDFQVKCR